MPRAPTLDGQQVQTNALRGGQLDVHASPDAFGAGIASGLQNLGGDVFNIWKVEQAKANESAINDAQAQADAAANALQLQHRALGGEDAVAKADEFKGQFAKATGDIAKKVLTNDAQRRAFGMWSQQRGVGFDGAIDGHAFQQGQQQQVADLGARKQTAVQRAVLNKDDPSQVSAAYFDLNSAASTFAKLRGMSPEQRNAADQQDAGDFWGSLVKAHLAEGNDLAASRILDQYKGVMDGQTVLQLSQATEVGSVQGESQRQAATIFSPGKTLEQMSAEADKIENQKVQAATKDRLKRLHELHQQGELEGQKKAMTDGWKLMQTDARGIDAVDKATTDDGTSLIIAMGPERYSALQAAERRRINGPIADPHVSASLVAQYRQLAVTNPAAFAKVDGTAPDANGISPLTAMTTEDYKSIFGSLQAEVKEKGTSGKLMQEIGEKERIIAETLAPLKIKSTISPDNGDLDKVMAFRQQFDAALAQARGDSGKAVDTATAQKIAAKLGEQVATEHRGWYNPARWVDDSDIKKPLYEAIADYEKKVPDDARAKLLADFNEKHKRAPRPDEIVARYRWWLSKNGGE